MNKSETKTSEHGAPLWKKFVKQAAIIAICILALSRFRVQITGVPWATAPLFIAFFSILFLIAVVIVTQLDERKLKALDYYPQDFMERDEREIALTARAARRSFMTMDFIHFHNRQHHQHVRR
jgi:hypothetical protein